MNNTKLQSLIDNVTGSISTAIGVPITAPPLTKDGGMIVTLEGDRELWKSLNGTHQTREAQLFFAAKAADSASAFGIICRIEEYVNNAAAESFNAEDLQAQELVTSGISGSNQSGDWITQIIVKIKYAY